MAYDSIAGQYDDFVRRSTIHRVSVPALLALCGTGRRILDLACGQGVVARALAGPDRTVVGVDASAALLDIARREETRALLNVTYVQDDACSLTALKPQSFDGVVCNLAFSDIDDLKSCFGAVRRVLKPGGWFAFATLHPCFTPPDADKVEVGDKLRLQVGQYFEEGRWWSADANRLLARLGWQHRTLSSLLNLLLDAGFVLDRFAEPRASEGIYTEVAVVLVVRALNMAF